MDPKDIIKKNLQLINPNKLKTLKKKGLDITNKQIEE